MNTLTATVFDSTLNFVGEGPLWHPITQTLYWVDFPNHILHSKKGDHKVEQRLDDMVTALAWVNNKTLLLASDKGLNTYNTSTHKQTFLCSVEADKPDNRSNDGRADPWGGFWISTMHGDAHENEGAIYRFHNGVLTQVVSDLTIPNGICFDKSRARAYYADSKTQKIYRFDVDSLTGTPIGESVLFFDYSSSAVSPDGAVIDSEGNMWIALWDGARVDCISPEAKVIQSLATQTPRPTCPAFGDDATTLYVTSAQCGLEDTPFNAIPHGATLAFKNAVKGVFEPCVKIDGF
ncbi:SMP-30/gluconolactonase/LRE family protein [Pseudoalteromonas sp. Z1A8]|uniref:SMP-30/gluconolactonase/LRE family protein n=1 Tax=Pseudoalteromonas sp. Z1A8 TaxID=2686354 RepID=UPI00140B8085|nr:SMP-30/gluconolactonase/LRE family protein [Pseudoalteromonas sp. Z1A8]